METQKRYQWTDGPVIETARQLAEARKILDNVEATMLAGVASVLTEVAEKLSDLNQDLMDARPSEWMTTQQAAEYLGFESTAAFLKTAARENIPKHYLSSRNPRYNRTELDTWMMSRPSTPLDL